MKQLILFFLLLLPISLIAQKESLKLFTSCNCDKNFIRQELEFTDHVRDKALANVTLFIYDIINGSGGRNYTLEFQGYGDYKDITNRIAFETTANMTSDDVRKGLLSKIRTGLLKYVMVSDLADKIEYSISNKGLAERMDIDFDDPWNNWIFEIRGSMKLDRESSRNEFEYEIGFESDRVTEKWRIRTDVQMNQYRSRFENDGEEFTSSKEEYSGYGSVVHSLSDHWSAGIFGGARHNTYTNIDLTLDLRPAIEYNIFPYREVLRREIVFAYKIGYLYNNYIETTIFGKDQESFFNHSLNVQVRFRQPWGNVSSVFSASSFLSDWTKNRLQMNSWLSVRIFKGLAVRFSGDVKFIKDQINLPAGSASIEDVLLQQKQIATNYEMGFGIGLSYTFGSAFNNVINTRL
jgi:hypothetical protein|tara:strand:- start:489 stop:1706 length:1218 start_codon:yes stop_codon:yes gene_type:complete